MDDALQPTIESVRWLARALALEPHGADDIAQEAWLDALRKRVEAPDLARWLIGATRRVARSIRRDEARRRERERKAARSEAVSGAGASAARMEVVARILTAVQELEEPQRTAVVLRFFEDLPPRAIARRLSLPVNTARSRVRRGLVELRARLDRDSLLALVPLALGQEAQPASEASPWAKVVIAAGVTAVLVGGTILLRESMEPLPGDLVLAAVDPLRAETRPGSDAPQDQALASPGSGRAGAARVEYAPEPAAGPLAAAATQVPEETEVEVVGRFLEADGRPAASLRVLLSESGVHMDEAPSRATAFEGLGDSLLALTDEQGRFRFRLQPVPHFDYSLDLEGAVARTWPVPRLRGGARVDLGDRVLAAGATILGRLVDAAGNPILFAGWKVEAQGEEPGSGEAIARAPVDPETGAYRLAGLPGGPYRLSARHPLTAPVEGPRIELAGEEARIADLVYAGPDLARRLWIDVETLAGCNTFPAPEHVHLQAPDGRVLSSTAVGGSPRSFAFDGLAPGQYTLSVDDSRFLPWSRDGLEPGTATPVQLTGSAALRFSIRDRRTAEPLGLFAVRARRLAPGVLYSEHSLQRGDAALADGLLAGVVPGSYALTVSCVDHGSETIEVELVAGETRRVELALGPGEWAAGKVSHADGSPAGGCALALLPAEAPHLRVLASARSGADGAFRLPLPSAGSFVLEARAEPAFTPAPRVVFSVGEDHEVEGLVLIIP